MYWALRFGWVFVLLKSKTQLKIIFFQKEIFIEGGSTAAAILEELNIKNLAPINELERGVVRMIANDLFITVKPGSYELPQQIKELYSIK